jgi:hypothetical protein
MRKAAVVVAALMAIALLPIGSAAQPRGGATSGSDVREFDPGQHRTLRVSPSDVREARTLGTAAATPAVGAQKVWLALDDAAGSIYPKVYTLRGIGDHIEVWVASDDDAVSSGVDFPSGDCRNDGVRNVISDADVQYLIDEFDANMYPTESAEFSVPPERDGRGAALTGILGLPNSYYRGPGDRIVALIDNVRDDNFYDTDNQGNLTYIAGFYWSLFDRYFNRLVMTIDAWDWVHRTRANPPNDPSSDPCANAPARPFLYEGTFAHEYQHLLENYVDRNEVPWVNEGISDYAQTITNYVDPTVPITDIGFDSHIQCFLGYNDQVTPANPIARPGGPENSLTRWGDQTDYEQEVLCDYGAAYSFMEYLAGQYGSDFLTALHLDKANGLDSLADLLTQEDPSLTAGTAITRWALMVAVDKVLDAGWTMVGGDPAQLGTPTLNADINWDNDQAYAAPGAPPNGSDYLRLRDDTDTYLAVDELTSIGFDGASELPAIPLAWKVDRTPPPGGDATALYSGKGDDLDRSIARRVRVRGNGRLSFDTWFAAEPGYDYAYVQVSDDGGERYRTVACTDSVPGPLGPAFNGKSHGWRHETCNLHRWAGERVIVSFRYVTDTSVVLRGYWIDDVAIGSHVVASKASLKGWDSPTEINPVDVQNFVVQLVAFDEVGEVVHVTTLPLDANLDGSLSGTALTDALGTTGSTVAAIVTYLDRSEQVQQQAPYTLTVNGVVQPGGGQT